MKISKRFHRRKVKFNDPRRNEGKIAGRSRNRVPDCDCFKKIEERKRSLGVLSTLAIGLATRARSDFRGTLSGN